MPQDGEKFSGKPFPTPANPGSLVCFMIEIPDDIKYRAALLGQIGWLADWRAWRHSDVDYVTEIPEVNIEIAGLFARALLGSSFGECMDCEGVALCIVESGTVQQAIADAISQSLLIQQAIIQQVTNYGSGLPGQPLTEPQAQIDTLPTNVKIGEVCDNDALWGAVLYLTQSANRAIEDFFQQIETLTNPVERGQLAATAVPAVGNYIALVPALVDQIAAELSEGYTAAYTETLEQQIACQMFCIAQLNCSLSIEQIIDIFAADLGELDISDFAVVMTLLTTGVLVGNQIVYAGFLLYFAALKFGQQFGDVLGLRPLTDLMGLGADYLASDNWATLCDCPDVETFDFTVSDHSFVQVTDNYAVYVAGEGWRASDVVPPPNMRLGIMRSLDYVPLRVIVTYSAAMPGAGAFCSLIDYPYPPYAAIATIADSRVSYDFNPSGYSVMGVAIDSGSNGTLPADLYIRSITIYH